VNIFTNEDFKQLTLDAYTTQLKTTGKYQPSRTGGISKNQENLLWEKHPTWRFKSSATDQHDGLLLWAVIFI